MPKATAAGVTGVIGGKLYVLPGVCSGDYWPNPQYCAQLAIRKLYRYDPASNTWAQMAWCPHFHAGGASGVINGKFYVAGGSGAAWLDVYDPATNSWKTLAAPVPTVGSKAAGAALNNKLFVIS